MPFGSGSVAARETRLETGRAALLRLPPFAHDPDMRALYRRREADKHRDAMARSLVMLAIFCTLSLFLEASMSLHFALLALLPRAAVSLFALAGAFVLRRSRTDFVQGVCLCLPVMAAVALTLALSRFAPPRVSGAYILVSPMIAARFIASVPMRLRVAAVLAMSAAMCELAVFIVSPPPLDLMENYYQVIFAALLMLLSLSLAVNDETQRQERFLLARRHEQAIEELRRLNARLLHLSTTDMLTGLANRRQFELELERAWADRDAGDLGLVMIDVDHFKLFNDSAGHAAGDACLRQVADTVLGSLSYGQHAARYGGEEFTVLLPGITAAALRAFGEMLRRGVVDAACPHPGLPGTHVTISVGLAWSEAAERRGTPDDLLRAADAALYDAKRAGRNRVAMAPAPARAIAQPAAE